MSFRNVIRSAVVVLFVILTLANLGAKKKTSSLAPVTLSWSGGEYSSTLPVIETMSDMEALFAHEPSYQEIQQVAMRYAEVHPEKIAAWRRGASLRAFLPRVDYDYDLRRYAYSQTRDRIETRYNTQDQLDEGETYTEDDNFTRQYEEHWTDPPSDTAWTLTERWSSDFDTGWSSSLREREDSGWRTDHDVRDRSYRDSRWRIRLQWDLADFLYSNEQRYISAEARRLVELRQDVLQEVNTYFFDRRRAQIEMLYSPPSDVRSRIDLQLQIARVTASIDALTGGYLSADLEKSRME
jgi:hypothetical protein